MIAKHHLNIFAVVALLAVLLTACLQRNSKSQSQAIKPTVAVSLPPQESLLKEIAGDNVYVICLLKEASNPETYEPSISDMMATEKCKAYFTAGGIGFEQAFIENMRENNRSLMFIDTSTGINYLMGNHGDNEKSDPHSWTSVINEQIIASNMAATLAEIDPQHARQYMQNLDKTIKRLQNLDKQFEQQLSFVGNKAFAVWHPTLSYFARDYNLEQIAFDNGKEPSASELKATIEKAKSHNVKVMVMQSQFDGRQAQEVCRQIGAEMVVFNPMAADIENELKKVVNAIAQQH